MMISLVRHPGRSSRSTLRVVTCRCWFQSIGRSQGLGSRLLRPVVQSRAPGPTVRGRELELACVRAAVAEDRGAAVAEDRGGDTARGPVADGGALWGPGLA